ncbi:hypothetical protein NLG97_g1472 [Lecanicillium saksenae]|uniref:Uncharacterized protein n=1 Tax=Lecanicillium saksenae TaxID=468837 RepID=A0ACC1R3M8_9HYPO|nr:hypothetical protein NLG97_g1472 [Lecanicillium saksenae]
MPAYPPPQDGMIAIIPENRHGHFRRIHYPPCECNICQAAFFSKSQQEPIPSRLYRETLSDAEAEQRALSMANRIHGHHQALKDQLAVFADTIMSRWRKMSAVKRETLLKEIAPGLEEKQWLIPRYVYTPERLDVFNKKLSRRRQLLLPWINVEVLKMNPAVLFALLHFRTAFPPHQWAAFDSHQLEFCWKAYWLDVDYARKGVIMHGDNYGSVVDWEKKAAHRGDILGFPRAILVLESQATVMEILDNVVTKILDGVSPTQPPRTEKWNTMVNNHGFKAQEATERWSPYTHPAFSAPPKFDLEHLLSLARSRREETGDHLCQLQCNEVYMRRYLKIAMTSEQFKKLSEASRGLSIVQSLLQDVRSHYWWCRVETELQKVHAVRKRYERDITPGKTLPENYELALRDLELLLSDQLSSNVALFRHLSPYVPGFQKHYRFDHESEKGAHITVLTDPETNACLVDDTLFWCIWKLTVDLKVRHIDHAMIFAMLEESLAKSAAERARIDEPIYQMLSDIAVCHEMWTALRMQRPCFRQSTPEELETTDDRRWYIFLQSNDAETKLRYTAAGVALIKNLYLVKAPTGPINRAWLKQKQELRGHLEEFWQSFRNIIRHGLERHPAFSAADVMMEPISANLSESYLDERSQEDAAILDAIEKQQRPGFVQKFTVTASPVERGPERREKAKTKGHPCPAKEAAPSPETAAEQQAESTTVTRPTPIRVTKYSLDVFHLMFPDKGKTPKDILWDRFVHAMADAGFTARNCGGSLVAFKHESHEGRIVFHRPHPDNKIDPIMLQAMGKRLTKWFGWERDLFVLRDD